MKPSTTHERAALHEALMRYAAHWPAESAITGLFVALLQDRDCPFVRSRLAGHFTSGAWLVSADGARVLMTHHRKLDRWLQLGGHADGDRDMARVALREAQEESGLPGLTLAADEIFDLDRHWIPQRKDVPGHWHYDVRYVVRAAADERYAVSDESHDLAWRPITALIDDEDESLGRMARKWLAAG